MDADIICAEPVGNVWILRMHWHGHWHRVGTLYIRLGKQRPGGVLTKHTVLTGGGAVFRESYTHQLYASISRPTVLTRSGIILQSHDFGWLRYTETRRCFVSMRETAIAQELSGGNLHGLGIRP